MAKQDIKIRDLSEPSEMSDELATKLGLKQYLDSNVSGGTVTLNTSGVAGPIVWIRGVFIPYQVQDGTWRLKFNMGLTHGSDTALTLIITGVLFKNISSYFQSLSVRPPGGSIIGRAYVNPNTDTVTISYNSGGLASHVSGDVELEAKPSWAV